MVVRTAAGAVRAVSMIQAYVKELDRKPFRADLKGNCMVRRGHESHRNQHVRCECEQQNTCDQLLAALDMNACVHAQKLTLIHAGVYSTAGACSRDYIGVGMRCRLLYVYALRCTVDIAMKPARMSQRADRLIGQRS
jgi:hypothetical protein